MKKLVLAASVASMLSASVQADTLLGLYIGGQVWNAAASGTFGENDGQGNIVLQDFTLDDQQQTSFHVALEHPIPLVPNIKIASTTLDTDGSNIIGDGFSFGNGITFIFILLLLILSLLLRFFVRSFGPPAYF